MMCTIRALTIFIFLSVPALATAAVVQVKSESDLIQRSDAVVMGTVVSVHAAVQPEGGVLTTAQVRVFRSLRGVAPGETIAVVIPGGKLKSGLTSMVAGAPRPEVGDWALLVLEKKAEVWTPCGLSLGWIELRGNAETGFVAYRELDGLSLVGPRGEAISSGVYRLRAIELEALWMRMDTQMRPLSSPSAGEVKP